MNPNRPARLNRTLLALIGVLLVVSGLLLLAVGTGLWNRLSPVPADWLAPAAPLPTTGSLPAWAPWVAAAAAVLIGLLALRWLIAQALRRPAGSDWQLAPDTSRGATHLDSITAAQPLAEEIEDLPGVQKATARLVGPRRQPHLYLQITADDRADLSDLRHRIDNDVLPRLIQALDLPALPVDLLLYLDTTHGSRTR